MIILGKSSKNHNNFLVNAAILENTLTCFIRPYNYIGSASLNHRFSASFRRATPAMPTLWQDQPVAKRLRHRFASLRGEGAQGLRLTLGTHPPQGEMGLRCIKISNQLISASSSMETPRVPHPLSASLLAPVEFCLHGHNYPNGPHRSSTCNAPCAGPILTHNHSRGLRQWKVGNRGVT